MAIWELLTSAIGGGATGLVGSAVTAWVGYSTQKLKNEHEREMARIELEHIKAESEANIKITEAQAAAEVEQADAKAFQDSVAAAQTPLFDKSYMTALMKSPWTRWVGALLSFLFGLVDFLRTLARPVLTYYLMGAATWITVMAWTMLSKMDHAISPEQALTLFDKVTTTLLYMTVSVVSWWFADRQLTKHAGAILAK